MTRVGIGKSGPRDGASTKTGAIRVMIVDDSLTARTVLVKIVNEAMDLVLCSTVNSAEQAIDKLSQVNVDVILLDLEMPGIGGLAALPEILARAGNARVLVVSSLTGEGAEATIAALSMGAADTILKPQPGQFTTEYRKQLANRIRSMGTVPKSSDIVRFAESIGRPKFNNAHQKSVRAVAIGASTGGIHSMGQILAKLPQDFAPALLITQHLPHSFISIFARQIEKVSSRKAKIAEDGMPLISGEIFIAPGDGHMLVDMCNGKLVTRISQHKVSSGHCPSVDPMFASSAEYFKSEMIGIVLSGMGRDGLLGARRVVDGGGVILAQSPETCAVWGMPKAVTEAGLASAVLPPVDLAQWIIDSKLASL